MTARTRDRRPLAVLTGASSGIGKALAFELASAGYDLILIARRGAELDSIKSLIETKFAVSVTNKALDVTASGAADEVFRELETLEVLVNCAGVATFAPFSQQTAFEDRAMVELNCLALTAFCHRAIAHLRPGSVIVNVSSLAAMVPLPYCAVYSASKAFVTTFSVALDTELSDRGIRVVSINPGGVETPFLKISGLNRDGVGARHLKLLTPERVALDIVRAIRRPRPIVVPGAAGWLARIATSVLPSAWLSRIVRGYYRALIP